MSILIIGCDHDGIDLKNYIVEYRNEIYTPHVDVDLMDVGCMPWPGLGGFSSTWEWDYPSVDYPDIAHNLIKAYKKSIEYTVLAILICETGIGMSMAANRYKGIRAAVVTNEFTAKMSRKHNDANILCLGSKSNYLQWPLPSRGTGLSLGFNSVAMDWVKIFANTEFEGGQHRRRIEKIGPK